ncbi:MAG: fasciclin domain-containing protein [Candidatus Saccharibacteria bacterium]
MSSQELKWEAATAKTSPLAVMADGKTVTIKQQGGKLFINDSQVVLYDIRTTNGVIHVIDTVLVP